MKKQSIGKIISGSLAEGFMMRLHYKTPLEQLKTGKFVSIQGTNYTFFSMITNLSLQSANPNVLQFPPASKESFLYHALKHDIYATASLKLMLMVDRAQNVLPVKTIPQHFASVQEANENDVCTIFGQEEPYQSTYFNVGTPLDMQTPVCINLERLTERSNGIFGKTGTRKTFLTRLVLAGLLKHEKAVCLIFDMHSEYGIQARKEGKGSQFVKGLKTLFPSKLAIFSLDPEATRRRGASADVHITIPYEAIHVQDIISLQNELNLHPTAVEAAYLLAGKYKHQWLSILLSQGANAKELADSIGAHTESIAALYRKLKRIEHLPFFTANAPNKKLPVIEQMLEYIDKGISIIIEFGNFTSTFCYLLIANIISRRIHDAYIKKTEEFLSRQEAHLEPKKLMIVIEEAHKFLNPQAAKQTIFGIIAREMRKYYVSLLVVDQRPSGIDDEVLSQIGTKIIAQLNDEKDIQSVLTGVHNASALRTVLGSLDTKQQALFLGHAMKMPIVVHTRRYDEKFYQEIAPEKQQTPDQAISELF